MNKLKRFHDLGLGLFVHYGLYSVIGRGEWIKHEAKIPDEEYDRLVERFNPSSDWADKLCEVAKGAGCKYIVLTTRHHDGFSLYDTKGLNPFDATALNPARDLVREFVDACRKYDVVPFFYHTLIDWREEQKFTSFSAYLEYLRKSVEILCSEYGEIGGIWFDGQWKYPHRDWEDDKLYGMIRSLQPNAVIANNSGLGNRGGRANKYIDITTYERGDIRSYDYDKNKDNFCAEMCQTLNSHWGYAQNDFDYKPFSTILGNYLTSRKFGGNLLVNVGPRSDGTVGEADRAILNLLGRWINVNGEALYTPEPYRIKLPKNAFALRQGKDVYVCITGLTMIADANVWDKIGITRSIALPFDGVKSAVWIDNGDSVEIKSVRGRTYFKAKPFPYGTNLLARIAKFTLL